MKTWKIPVYWKVLQVAEIQANSLEEAMILAKLQSAPKITTSHCTVCEQPKVTDDEEYLRWSYNDGQTDD